MGRMVCAALRCTHRAVHAGSHCETENLTRVCPTPAPSLAAQIGDSGSLLSGGKSDGALRPNAAVHGSFLYDCKVQKAEIRGKRQKATQQRLRSAAAGPRTYADGHQAVAGPGDSRQREGGPYEAERPQAPREVFRAAPLTASLRPELAVPTPCAWSATDRLKSQVPVLT